MIELLLNFRDNKTSEKMKLLSKVTANPTPFLGSLNQNMSNVDMFWFFIYYIQGYKVV